MSIELRPITEDEYEAFYKVPLIAFGGGEDDHEEIENERSFFEYDRSLVAVDGDQFVGTAGAFSFDLTLPGLSTTPAAGVTWVSVLPTHRRQGVLRSMMVRQLDDVAERGEALAILTASESLIYGRFGYGLATSDVCVKVDLRHSAFLPGIGPVGRVRLVEADEAGKLLPGIYDEWRRRQPGAITRSPQWWDAWVKDPKSARDGFSERRYAVHETEPGEPDGYVAYRVKAKWESGFPGGLLRRLDHVALSPDAHTSLWRYCLDVDLVASVIANVPADEPLRWQLLDPRRFKVEGVPDMLWVRLVDVAAALSARTYPVAGRLVFDVHDAFRPQSSGRYALQAGPDGASCDRLDGAGDADLTLEVDALGAAYLGGVTFTTLARAGRVRAALPAALRLADAMFASTPAPYCNTGF